MLLILISNSYIGLQLLQPDPAIGWGIAVLAFVCLFMIQIKPIYRRYPQKRLEIMAGGSELLVYFLTSLSGNVILFLSGLCLGLLKELNLVAILIHILIIILVEALVFWNGMIRVYLTSVQLGMKWRIIGILLGWVPVVNIAALLHIRSLVAEECRFETEKLELDAVRTESEICKTKYPILLVHGVFFRDTRYLNYWGRIPKVLLRNGATVYYGGQQSAESVECCGRELAEHIGSIIKETGCEKVNIIAHSKGGLDSRYAISCLGISDCVASLTTINTPHRGCIFAEHLLHKIPDAVVDKVASAYNRALKKLGDQSPDFISAVSDLTSTRCEAFNKIAPDVPGVYYQSVGSVMARAGSGKFPLNLAYPMVKHFDGANDGLVALESANWGSRFIALNRGSGRGISHGDMIDLNRENINGFDIREFYVNLVKDLKNKGM